MTSYDFLFKRAKTVLRTRFDIALDESYWTAIEPFLQSQLLSILEKDKIQTEEIKLYLELLKRQNPSKFYLLELDVIKEIRNYFKKNQAPTVRKVNESQIAVVDINKRRDEPEHDDNAGFIYR